MIVCALIGNDDFAHVPCTALNMLSDCAVGVRAFVVGPWERVSLHLLLAILSPPAHCKCKRVRKMPF